MMLGRLWMTLTWVGRRCHGAYGVLLAVNVTGKPELFLEEHVFYDLLHWFRVLGPRRKVP